jgi:hypothetical protein
MADVHAETVAWMDKTNVKDIFEVRLGITAIYVSCCCTHLVILAFECSELQVITSQLLYHKPDDPKKFIIETLTTLQNQGAKPLLDEVDVNTMFDMFDVTQQGVLTKKQAYRAVRTVLGADHVVVQAHSADQTNDETLTKKDFLSYVSAAMADAAPKLGG